MALPSVDLVLDLYAGLAPLSAGSASLKPSAVLTDVQDQAVITRQPVTASFGESPPVVPLIPTDDPNLEPSGWTWGVTFSVGGGPAAYSFFLPAGPADFTATHATPCVFTFTPTTELTELPNGTGVQLSGESVPAGFTADTTYYVVAASEDTFELAATSGGEPIASTGTGSGSVTVAQWNLSALTPVASTTMMTPYLILPSGTPSDGDVPVATGDGNATAWGSPSGGGDVSSVTAADASIVIGGTGDEPTVATGTLDVIATQHPPAAAWSNNGKKITSVANGSSAQDAVAYGQLGTAAFLASSAFDAAGAATGVANAVAAELGADNGIATLDSGGHVPAAQLPSATTSAQGAVIIDGTAGDIQPSPGTRAAGSVGKPADAGHVHGQPPFVAPTGITGATAATRYMAATVAGPPTSGTWAVGDLIPDQAGAIWECVIAGTAPTNGQFKRMGDHSWQFRPESYGAVTGIFTTHDAVMASTSSGVLTSASGLFTPAMVGWLALVNVGAAGANQAPLITTIASYQSATQVTLSANPAATAAGNPAIFAPDNTAALQAAWAAAQAYAAASPFRSGELRLADLYAMGTAPTLGSTSGPFYGYSLLPITVPDTTGAMPKMNLRIVAERGPGDELNYWEQLTGQLSGSGIVVLQAAPASNGTWGIPSVIGGPTVATWSGGSLTGGFANIRLDIEDLKIVVPYNPGWIGVDGRFLACLSGTRYGYQSFAVGVLGGGLGPNLGSTPGGSWNFNGAGLRFPVRNNNDLCDFGSITCEGVADAFWFADHVSIRKLTSIDTFNGIVLDTTSGSGSGFLHGSWIGEYSCEANGGSCILVSGAGISHFPLVIGLLDSENSSTPNTVTDSGILTGTVNWYDITATVPKVSGSTGLKIVNCRLAPGLWASPPAVPATTVAVAASALPWRDAMVNVQPNGATITAITVGGTALTGVTAGPVLVPSGSAIALAYTGGTPTWQWQLL